MKLTDEQLLLIGDYHFDELPFKFEEVDQKQFWEALPLWIQCAAILDGAEDTVVRENIFIHVISTQFGCTPSQYYHSFPKSGNAHGWFANTTVPPKIDYKKLKPIAHLGYMPLK